MKKLLSLVAIIMIGFMLTSCNADNIPELEQVVESALSIYYDESVAIEMNKNTMDATSRGTYFIIKDLDDVIYGFDADSFELYREDVYVYIDNGQPIDWLDYIGQYNVYTYADNYYLIYENN